MSITNQILRVFPSGALRIEALAREGIIIALWASCKPTKAQQGVASFVSFTLRNFQAKKIGAGKPATSTPAAVSDLIDAMLVAVGLSPVNLPLAPVTTGTDFGTGFADGTSPGRTVVQTNSGAAAGSFQGNAFGEPTVITVFRRPDSPQLVTNGENQFAPFYDYNASNASNNHIVVNGELFVGFCLEDFVTYPANIEVGHNPPQINEGGPSGLPFFEILERLTQAEYNSLGLTLCPTLQNPASPSLGLNFKDGLPAFASSAWLTGSHYLRSLAEELLPERVEAAAPRNTGAGGRTTSYSPFGVVEPIFFNDGFEAAAPAWTTTGFWHRSTLKQTGGGPIVNAAFPSFVNLGAGDGSAGALPNPFAGTFAMWYGEEADGNYIGTQVSETGLTGGTSTAANNGEARSPVFTIPESATDPVLRFRSWFEIEGVNPDNFDVMSVLVDVNGTEPGGETFIAALNPPNQVPPFSTPPTPFTSAGLNLAPVWEEQVYDLSNFTGQSVQLVFRFVTVDHLYNGFRGWIIDNVRVENQPLTTLRMAPRAGQGSLVPPARQSR